MSIGKIELLYSMIHFDKTLASFNTYLFQRIYGNILRFIRDEKEWCKNIDMDLNTIKNKSHDISNTILIKEILSSLSERERKILELYYLENNTLREISDKLDLSTNCIFINKIKALKRIKETFDCL
jgi:RNA polymerase sigma factor (sigma-70 family)